MKRAFRSLSKTGVVLCEVAVAVALIFGCFLNFRMQVNSYIDEDMRSQIEAVQKNSALLIQNELDYLKNLTASMALTLSHAELQTDEDILQILEGYAETSNVVRALFVTFDGCTYTSYDGYQGQNEENTRLDGVLLSEIRELVFSQPFYTDELDEVIFGVVAPVTMGGIPGVLVSSYNIREFPSLLENSLLDGTAQIGIVSSAGKVVSGETSDQFGLDIFDALSDLTFEQSSAEAMRADFAEGKQGFSVYSAGDAVHYCTYGPIDANDWYVVVTITENSLRGKLVNLEQYGLWLTVELVVIMLGLLCAIVVGRLREQKRIQAILERAAQVDGLTGVYNRKAVEDAITQSISEAGENASATLLVIDLDDFKNINDEGGHLWGDAVLRECASRLQDAFGAAGIVGRIGGDEFVVYLPGDWDVDQVEEKTNALIRDFYVLTDAGERKKVSISVGMARASLGKNSFLSLYQLADAALYRAKQTGKSKLSD